MKKLIVTFVAIVATSTAIYAQIDRWPELALRAGVYHSYMRLEQNLDLDRVFNPGFNAALEIDIPVGVFLSLQPEIGFIQKGIKYRSTTPLEISGDIFGLAQSHTNRILFNVLETSFFTKFYAIDNTLLSMAVMVGPSVGINLSADEITLIPSESTVPSSRTISLGEGQTFKRMDASIVGALNFRFVESLVVDLRFQLGISNVNNSRTPDIFHRGTSLSVGYLFSRKY